MGRQLFESMTVEQLKEKAKVLPTPTLRAALNGMRISPSATSDQIKVFEKELKRRES